MKARKLTLKQRVFVDKLTDPTSPKTFLNQTQAYQSSHPDSSYDAARSSACDALATPNVQTAVVQQLERRGFTKESLGADLQKYQLWAEEKRDYVGGASIAMDCAKLGGFLVEKREVVSVDDSARATLRDLVKQSLAPAKDS